MKVYLLWKSEEYEAPWLIGVFSTKEKAEETIVHCKEVNKEEDWHPDGWYNYDVDEREVK